MSQDITLTTEFSGIQFPNPFVLPSAQSVRTGDMIRRAFEAGWGGAVTQTLTMESGKIHNVRPRLDAYWQKDALIGVMNIELVAARPLDTWLQEIYELKESFPEHPIIASIMGQGDSSEEWVCLADKCAEAGADALELNISIPHGMTEQGTGAIIGQDPERTRLVTSWVTSATQLPVFVKLTPNVTDISAIARAAEEGGASGVTAVNNLKALAGIDIENFQPQPSVQGFSSFGGYAGPGLKPVALRCVAEIAKATSLPIVGTGGVSGWEDAVEYLLAGASLVQVYTGVMKHGYGLIDSLIEGLSDYMERKSFCRVSELTGLVLSQIVAHGSLQRVDNLKAAYSRDLCIRCGQCYMACEDAGFQAVVWAEDEYPFIDNEACDACGLCLALCPVEECMWLEEMESN